MQNYLAINRNLRNVGFFVFLFFKGRVSHVSMGEYRGGTFLD